MNKMFNGCDKASGPDATAFVLLLNDARIDERKNQASVASARMVRIAAYIVTNDLSVSEAVELLRQEADAIENQAQELH